MGMRRKKYLLSILMCGVFVTFTGCGTKAYDLSETDRQNVANYAAHVLTKHNTGQSEGLTYMEFEPQAEEDSSQQSENTDTKTADNSTDQSAGNANNNAQNTASQEPAAVSLEQALGLGNGVTAAYSHYDVTDSYVEADYFSMNASAGKTYVVIHIDLTATGGEASCDMLSKKLSYRLSINGEKAVGAQTSILLNDLSTYQGTVGTQPTDCVLLFEVSADKAQNITSLDLKIGASGNMSTVKLQ